MINIPGISLWRVYLGESDEHLLVIARDADSAFKLVRDLRDLSEGSFAEIVHVSDGVEEESWKSRSKVEKILKNSKKKTKKEGKKVKKEDYEVHASHCCFYHGCKYGNDNCPVELGLTPQIQMFGWCQEPYLVEDPEICQKTGIPYVPEEKID